jgi:hypothetical protein
MLSSREVFDRLLIADLTLIPSLTGSRHCSALTSVQAVRSLPHLTHHAASAPPA